MSGTRPRRFVQPGIQENHALRRSIESIKTDFATCGAFALTSIVNRSNLWIPRVSTEDV